MCTCNRMQHSLRVKKIPWAKFFDQNYGTQLKYILFKNLSERKLKKKQVISSGKTKNMTSQAPSWAPHLKRCTRYFRHGYSINFLNIKWIQRLLNPTNALWKDLIQHQLNLILNSNQVLAYLDKQRSLILLDTKNLQKQSNEDFFVPLLNA